MTNSLQVRASSMLACQNSECCRRFCEHCLVTHLNEDVDPMSSCAWSLLDGKVKIYTSMPFVRPVVLTCFTFCTAGLALPDLQKEVLLLAERLQAKSQALQGLPLPPPPGRACHKANVCILDARRGREAHEEISSEGRQGKGWVRRGRYHASCAHVWIRAFGGAKQRRRDNRLPAIDLRGPCGVPV